MSNRRHRLLSVYTSAAVAFAALCNVLERRREAELRRPIGLYSAIQIMDRTLPLCRAIAPEVASPHLRAELIHIQERDAKQRRVWAVEMVEASTGCICFQWDADTGELWSVGRESSPPDGAMRQSPMTAADAMRTAWRWMFLLGISDTAKRWRIDGPPEQRSNAWQVFWQAGDRKAMITIDDCTGQLNSARVSRPSQHR